MTDLAQMTSREIDRYRRAGCGRCYHLDYCPCWAYRDQLTQRDRDKLVGQVCEPGKETCYRFREVKA